MHLTQGQIVDFGQFDAMLATRDGHVINGTNFELQLAVARPPYLIKAKP